MSVGDQSPVLAGLLAEVVAEVVAPVGQRVVDVPVPGGVDHVGRDEAQPYWEAYLASAFSRAAMSAMRQGRRRRPL